MSAHGTIRVEDDQLLRGEGRYADDAKPANLAYAHFVRSPHAHARIKSVDTAEARKAPKVLAVLTAKDMDGVGSVSRHPPMIGRNGFKLIMPHRPALAGEKVTHVGQPVAVVIAETLAAAQDAVRARRGRIRGTPGGDRRARRHEAGRAAALCGCARQSRLRFSSTERR